jgi:hypothetical protein
MAALPADDGPMNAGEIEIPQILQEGLVVIGLLELFLQVTIRA